MRRRAELEGVDHAAEIGIDVGLAVTRDLERPVHDVGPMVTDCARGEFDAVADDVVLPRENVERIHRLQCLHLALRHRERIVAEIDLLGVFVIFEHREIDDPAEFERALFDQLKFFTDPGTRRTGELGRLAGLACGKEQPIVVAEAQFGVNRLHAVFAVVLGDRSAEVAAFARNIAEACIALAARPFVHLVEEFAALFGGARRKDRAHDAA